VCVSSWVCLGTVVGGSWLMCVCVCVCVFVCVVCVVCVCVVCVFGFANWFGLAWRERGVCLGMDAMRCWLRWSWGGVVGFG